MGKEIEEHKFVDFIVDNIIAPVGRSIFDLVTGIKKLITGRDEVKEQARASLYKARYQMLQEYLARTKQHLALEVTMNNLRLNDTDERFLFEFFYRLDSIDLISYMDDGMYQKVRIKGDFLVWDQKLDCQSFEKLCMYLLRVQGWDVEVTEKEALNEGAEPIADGGVDVIGTKDDRKVYLQANHYIRLDKKVGRPVVQQIYGVAAMEGATDVIVATSGEFTSFAVNAVENRSNNEFFSPEHFMIIELWDRTKIANMIDKLSNDDYSELMLQPFIKFGKTPYEWEHTWENYKTFNTEYRGYLPKAPKDRISTQ